jgi:hypothetical protein
MPPTTNLSPQPQTRPGRMCEVAGFRRLVGSGTSGNVVLELMAAFAAGIVACAAEPWSRRHRVRAWINSTGSVPDLRLRCVAWRREAPRSVATRRGLQSQKPVQWG